MNDQDDTFAFSLDMLDADVSFRDAPELLDDDDIHLLMSLDDEFDIETE